MSHWLKYLLLVEISRTAYNDGRGSRPGKMS